MKLLLNYISMQLVLDTKDLKLTSNGNTFVLISAKGKRTISPGKLSSIAITANIILSSSAVKLSIRHQIPIMFFDYIGKAQARLWSPYFESIATLRRQQVRFTEATMGSDWMVEIFHLKTSGQLANIKWLKGRKSVLSGVFGSVEQQIRKVERGLESFRTQLPEHCRSSMMGVEGTIARLYWQAVGNGLPRSFSFQKRSRQPAEDITNAAINYLYGMLYSVVEGGLFAAGLDPYLGILHADNYRKPTLTFDMIEPFRPWVDRIIMEAIFRKEVKVDFFTKNQHGIYLNKTGKAYFIPLFNNWLRSEREYLGRNSIVRNHVYFLCGRLAQRIRTSQGD